jgi:hypothetical protein
MASNTYGAANGFGTHGGTAGSSTPITFVVSNAAGASLGAGFVMPPVSAFALTHGFKSSESMDGVGEIDSITLSGEYIECQFDLVFSGSSVANQAAGERSFPIGATVTISGAPVRAFGPFTDAINVTSGGIEGYKWIYVTGTNIRRSSGGESTGSVTLRRYPKISGASVIVM